MIHTDPIARGSALILLMAAVVLALASCSPVQRRDDAFRLPWLAGRQTAYGTITTLRTQHCENEQHRPFGVSWKTLGCDIFVSEGFEYLGETGDVALFFAQDGSFVGGMFRTRAVSGAFAENVEARFGPPAAVREPCEALQPGLVRCEAMTKGKTVALLTQKDERQTLTLWYADELPKAFRQSLCEALAMQLPGCAR